MAKFKFYLKDPKAEKTTSIMLVCQWSNQQVKVYTGKTILPEYWNGKEGKARNVQEFRESRKLNAFLASKEEEAKNLYWDMELRMKRPPTKSEYKVALQTLLETGKVNLENEIPTFEEFVEAECKIIQAVSDSEGRLGKSSAIVHSYRDTLSA